MANHKSAAKRDRQSIQRRGLNRANKTRVKSVIKALDQAIEEQSIDKAREALVAAIPVIDHAAVKGAFHKKKASRQVSRLTKRVNKFVKSKAAAA